jgi:hypothetical protein
MNVEISAKNVFGKYMCCGGIQLSTLVCNIPDIDFHHIVSCRRLVDSFEVKKKRNMCMELEHEEKIQFPVHNIEICALEL